MSLALEEAEKLNYTQEERAEARQAGAGFDLVLDGHRRVVDTDASPMDE